MIKTSFYSANQKHHYHPEVVAYYYKEWQDFQMDFHLHEAIEIMYVISGECYVDLENDRVALKKGQFILIDSYAKHRLIVEHNKKCRMLNVEFVLKNKNGMFPSINHLAGEDDHLSKLLNSQQDFVVLKDLEGLYHTLKTLVLELAEKGERSSELMIQVLISQLILKVARIFSESKHRTSLPTDVYVRKVINYIHHHYDIDLKIADLAELVYLHPSYLHRIFKDSMDCTIMEYITEVRVDQAKMLLAKTEIPITEISEYVGINSRQYFSFIFKKMTGETPQNYRKTRQKTQKYQ